MALAYSSGYFLIIELLSFSAFFLFFTVSAIIMATITWGIPSISTSAQLIIFAVLAVISCILWYKIYNIYKKTPKNKEAINVNTRLSQYIGKQVTLVCDVQNNVAKAKIGDTQWRVEIKESLKAGDSVIITGFSSTTLYAIPYNTAE